MEAIQFAHFVRLHTIATTNDERTADLTTALAAARDADLPLNAVVHAESSTEIVTLLRFIAQLCLTPNQLRELADRISDTFVVACDEIRDHDPDIGWDEDTISYSVINYDAGIGYVAAQPHELQVTVSAGVEWDPDYTNPEQHI